LEWLHTRYGTFERKEIGEYSTTLQSTDAGDLQSKGVYCAKKESQLREGIKPTC